VCGTLTGEPVLVARQVVRLFHEEHGAGGGQSAGDEKAGRAYSSDNDVGRKHVIISSYHDRDRQFLFLLACAAQQRDP